MISRSGRSVAVPWVVIGVTDVIGEEIVSWREEGEVRSECDYKLDIPDLPILVPPLLSDGEVFSDSVL